jgi:hypothetical protein
VPFWSKAIHIDLATDAALLETLFAAKEAKSLVARNSVTVSGTERKSAGENGVNGHTPQKLSILDPKRANNIEIMISKKMKEKRE